MFYDTEDLKDSLMYDDIETNVNFEEIVDEYRKWFDEEVMSSGEFDYSAITSDAFIEDFIDSYHITDKQVENIAYSVISNIVDNMTDEEKLDAYEYIVRESLADIIYNYLDDNQQIDELRYEIESKLNDMIIERLS